MAAPSSSSKPAAAASAAPAGAGAAPLTAAEFECAISIVPYRALRLNDAPVFPPPLKYMFTALLCAVAEGAELTSATHPPMTYKQIRVTLDSPYTNECDAAICGESWCVTNCNAIDELMDAVSAGQLDTLADPASAFPPEVYARAAAVIGTRSHVQLLCDGCGSDVNAAKLASHLDSKPECCKAVPKCLTEVAGHRWVSAPFAPNIGDLSALATFEAPVPNSLWFWTGHQSMLLKQPTQAATISVADGAKLVPLRVYAATRPKISVRRGLLWLIDVTHATGKITNRNQNVRARSPALAVYSSSDDVYVDVERHIALLAVRPQLLPRDEQQRSEALRLNNACLGDVLLAIYAQIDPSVEANQDLERPVDPDVLKTVYGRLEGISRRSRSGTQHVDDTLTRLLDARDLLRGVNRKESMFSIDARVYSALRDVVCTAVADAMQALAPDADAPQVIDGGTPLPGFPADGGWTFAAGTRITRRGLKHTYPVSLWGAAMLLPADATDAKVALLEQCGPFCTVASVALSALRPTTPSSNTSQRGAAADPPPSLVADAVALLTSYSSVKFRFCEWCSEFVPAHALALHKRRHRTVIAGVPAQVPVHLMSLDTALGVRADALCRDYGVTAERDGAVVRLCGQNAHDAAADILKLLSTARFTHRPYAAGPPGTAPQPPQQGSDARGVALMQKRNSACGVTVYHDVPTTSPQS